MSKNDLTLATEYLVAYRKLYFPTNSLSKKVDRRMGELAEGIYQRLSEKEKLSPGSFVVADIETKRSEARSRTLTEAVKEFIEENPEIGKKLQKKIDEKRKKKKTYLVYGLVGQEDLPEDFYIELIKEICPDFDKRQARSFYKLATSLTDQRDARKLEKLERKLLQTENI